MSRGLLRATLTLLAGGALAQLLPLLLGPWLTRIYSPTEFGQFSFLWALASNVAVVACARYEFALPMETDAARAAVLMALCARLLLAVTAASAVFGLIWWAWQDLALVWLMPLVVGSAAATQWLTMWATSARRFQWLALSRVLQYGGAALLQLLFGLAGLGALGLLLGPVLAGLAAAALLARPAPQGGWAGLWRIPRSAMAAMAAKHRDFPLFNTPHAFAGAMQDSLAMLLIAAWTGDAAAGFWALALRYSKAPASLIGGALSQVLYPRLVAAVNGAEALALVRRTMGLLLLLGLALMLALFVWGPWAFAALFGERWQEAGEVARALSPYIALHFVASPLSVAMMAWGAQAWGLRLALAGQLLFVAGLAGGLALGGLIGAAWGVSAAMLGYFVYFFWALAHWQDFPCADEHVSVPA
ncbi:lipopolysaccharide biosynthesis protein [Roseateles oligotrophus]|uniref:Oligosaccharide flippase family protein n=1 Tax=Roseateles oligotrophus TaxID=1769250 RepID=A0ABT2YDY8_9BURK|nr:oligosaccharide flippase family protein [Roseateles oligotrophus]MCV2368272.1 oligosaccharide flippase family protein [Roseateles oligotrophus]